MGGKAAVLCRHVAHNSGLKPKFAILSKLLTPNQSQCIAWLLSRRMGADSADMLATTLVDTQVDLNPHQVKAALFAENGA